MYHRYSPTPGGFKRETVPDPPKPDPPAAPPMPPAPPPSEVPSVPDPPRPSRAVPAAPPDPIRAAPPPEPLRLLTRFFPGWDTGDLLVLLILVLLLSDGTDDSGTLAMTLAIFLFLQ